METCRDFRARLARALSGGARERGLAALGWHAHLSTCAACRELLEAEEALEALLASLPEPELPPELARRVLRRLEAARLASAGQVELALDRLLALDAGVRAPAHLSASLLARLGAERELQRRTGPRAVAEGELDQRLERLLARAPAPSVPAGLAERVLAGLAAERGAPRSSSGGAPLARLAAAAALCAALGGAAWLARSASPPAGAPAADYVDVSALELPEEFLETMPVLVNWELLQQTQDIDTMLSTIEIDGDWIAWER